MDKAISAKDMDRLLRRLEENEDIARKFHEIEIEILSVLNFIDLFESLLTALKEKFHVPYVWISLIEQSEVSTLIQSLEESDTLRDRLNIIDRASFVERVGRSTKPLLINKDLGYYSKLMLNDKTFQISSMALAPISLDGEIIGSLNQGDSSPMRFRPGIDTSLLERLSVKVSLCISNVTAHEKLRFLAYHDPLTGLLNRRVMAAILEREFNRMQRYGNPLSLAFLDLDDFKRINDQYGHDCGDRLLTYVAERLIEVSRISDIVSRFAGDEFIVILPQTTRENAEALMNRFRDNLLENPLVHGGIQIPISVTFGVSSTEDKTIGEPDLLIKRADEIQYEAKKNKTKKKPPRNS